jgi:hypothetical protein
MKLDTSRYKHLFPLLGPELFIKMFVGFATDPDISLRCNQLQKQGKAVSASTLLANCDEQLFIVRVPPSIETGRGPFSFEICKQIQNFCSEQISLLWPAYTYYKSIDPSLKVLDCKIRDEGEIIDTYNELRNHVKQYFALSSPGKIVYDKNQEVGPHFELADNVGVLKVGNKPCILLHPVLLPFVLLHEGDPGHHLMYNLLQCFPQLNDEDNMACIEGWGMYCERFYPPKPTYHFGFICSMLFHFIRAYCDMGLVCGVLSKSSVQDLLKTYVPFPIEVAREIEHYLKHPGMQCCYILGYQMFDTYAKKQRTKFKDWKDFHSDLLQKIKEKSKNKQVVLQDILFSL